MREISTHTSNLAKPCDSHPSVRYVNVRYDATATRQTGQHSRVRYLEAKHLVEKLFCKVRAGRSGVKVLG